MIEMTLEMAEKAVKAAQAKAKELGTPITVTVVDEAGRLVLCARGDGTGFLTPETSRGKAMASVAFRRPTKEMVDLAREHPAFWNAMPGLAPGQILAEHGRRAVQVGGPCDRRHRLRRRHRRGGSPVRAGRRGCGERGLATAQSALSQADLSTSCDVLDRS